MYIPERDCHGAALTFENAGIALASRLDKLHREARPTTVALQTMASGDILVLVFPGYGQHKDACRRELYKVAKKTGATAVITISNVWSTSFPSLIHQWARRRIPSGDPLS